MAYTAGETITRNFNTGHAADTWTVLAALKPSGASFTPTITEVSAGVYRVSFATAAGEHGEWYLSIEGAASGEYEYSWDIDPAGVTTITPTAVVGGTTLRDLRRRLGYRLGDIIVATGTQAGTANQFYDEVTLRRADDAYRSWEAYVASAAVAGNVGVSRAVQGSTQSGGAITVQPPLTAGDFAAGDVVELHGSAGVGWSVAEKHAAINDAISQAATMGGIEAVADSAGLFDRDTPLLTVPSQLRFVHNLEWLDSDGLGHSIPYAKGRGKPGWWANKATGQIEIIGGYRESADGKTLRFWGHGDHIALTADTDATLVNATWLVAEAAYQLVMSSGFDRNPEKARALIADLRQDRAIWRRAATRVRPASSIAVRGY